MSITNEYIEFVYKTDDVEIHYKVPMDLSIYDIMEQITSFLKTITYSDAVIMKGYEAELEKITAPTQGQAISLKADI